MRSNAASRVGYVTLRSSIAFLWMNGSSGLMRSAAMASFTARSGSWNACVGRLWQSMQSIVRRSPLLRILGRSPSPRST